MAQGSMFTKTYTTNSGVDITAIFDNISLATLTGIAISVTREKVPVYTMGSANPRSISRGKRGTAGSLMFTLFDRDAFYGLFCDPSHYYYAHADEVNWLTNPINVAQSIGMYYNASAFGNTTAGGTQAASGTAGSLGAASGASVTGFDYMAGYNNNPALGGPAGGAVQTGTVPYAAIAGQTPTGQVGARTVRRAAMYADQVMPFDITLVAQNEYGHASASGVVGVEIINEGGGISMDDITNEQQMTYIAIYRLPWFALNGTNNTQQESIYGGVTSLTNTSVNAAGQYSVDLSNNSAKVQNQ